MSNGQQLYDLFIQLYMLLDDGDRQLLSRFDLTVPRFYLLVHLGNEPGLSPQKLSEVMFCDKSNITRLVQNLIRRGLVEKRPHETDGRSYRLYLTAEGDALRHDAVIEHQKFNAARLSQAPEELLPLLTSLHTNLHRTVHG